jgi:glycosyltransferase involved in cell wall biosynthesis
MALRLFRPIRIEQRMVHRIFGNSHIPSSVVGVGVDVPTDVNADRFRAKYGIAGDFILYIGRVDQSKNVHELFDFFLAFQAKYKRDLKLVIMGNGALPIPQHPDIVPLGFITGQDKFDGLAAAAVLVLPSKYESLSIAILEAWLAGTPVLVNGDCDVLKEQCRVSNGGLWYQSRNEFEIAWARCSIGRSCASGWRRRANSSPQRSMRGIGSSNATWTS